MGRSSPSPSLSPSPSPSPGPSPSPRPSPDAIQASEYKPRIGKNQGVPTKDDDEDDDVDDADRGEGTHEYECTKCGYTFVG